jgi:hypothetical protein
MTERDRVPPLLGAGLRQPGSGRERRQQGWPADQTEKSEKPMVEPNSP